MTTPVYLEVGSKKVFAAALSWPGWCRAGKTEEAALAALAEYASRYAVVARAAGLPFPEGARIRFDVVERLPGNATTDFGAPDRFATSDTEEVTATIAARQSALVGGAWQILDAVTGQSPAELRKGPRGGGRDRDKMIDHVLAAEAAYARKLGIRHRTPARDDTPAVEALRADVLHALGTPNDGQPPRTGGWPTRYAARRIAWHALDHAWEMQDRAG